MSNCFETLGRHLHRFRGHECRRRCGWRGQHRNLLRQVPVVVAQRGVLPHLSRTQLSVSATCVTPVGRHACFQGRQKKAHPWVGVQRDIQHRRQLCVAEHMSVWVQCSVGCARVFRGQPACSGIHNHVGLQPRSCAAGCPPSLAGASKSAALSRFSPSADRAPLLTLQATTEHPQ